MTDAGVWSTQQLVEFLAAVSSSADESSAIRSALERAAEALEAELGLIELGGVVVATVGFAPGSPIEAAVLRASFEQSTEIALDDLGQCRTLIVPIEGTPPGRLMLVRSGLGEFDRGEASLVRGMARVLGVTVAGLRALDNERTLREQSEQQMRENALLLMSLRERQDLLERLASIQRSISQRVPLDELLHVITAGAQELLGDDVVGLRLIDPEDPDTMVMAASSGVDRALFRATRRMKVGDGVGGRSIVEGRLVIVHDYQNAIGVSSDFRNEGLRSAMAAPVREDGRIVGSLTVGSWDASRRYSTTEQEVLLAFAEHASIAITDARTVEAKLHQAFHDPLTGLPNRALFLDRLEEALRPGMKHRSAAVMYIDVDRFKVVNDSLGHTAGDQLLVQIAQRLQSCLRPGDTAARLGGDEFAIILPRMEAESSSVGVAERVIQAMRPAFMLCGRNVHVTVSIGVALSDAGDDASNLLRNADLSMYQAKTSGGAQFRLYEQGMHAAIIDRLQLEGDLREAIDRGDLRVEFQPIVDLESEQIKGFEALTRWRHPTRGPIAPTQFIKLAEEAGMISDLGHYVLTEACEWAQRWQALSPGLTMTVNLSPRQFTQAGLVDDVADVLMRTGLHPDLLVLEITENILMEETEISVDRLHALKGLGVRLAIDDFGTGYSSLSYLRRFPIDILKVDRSFVEGVADGPEDSALARAIVGLGRTLNLDVIAEGIEQVRQRDTLRSIRCKYGQGFLYSASVDAAHAAQLLARHNLEQEEQPTFAE